MKILTYNQEAIVFRKRNENLIPGLQFFSVVIILQVDLDLYIPSFNQILYQTRRHLHQPMNEVVIITLGFLIYLLDSGRWKVNMKHQYNDDW
jgi:hypothetical protein